MSRHLQDYRESAKAQIGELLEAIASAETIIVSTIERECEALRTGRMLAAEALHLRLCDAAQLYLNGARAARASLSALEPMLPGSGQLFENRRAAFSHVLKVELAVLAAERKAAAQAPRPPTGLPSGGRQTAAGGQGPAQMRPRKPEFHVVNGRQENAVARGIAPTRRWNPR